MVPAKLESSVSVAAPGAPRDDVDRIATLLVDNIDAMVAFWDRNQRCVFANAAYRAWFGKTRDEMIGMPLSALLGPSLYAQNLPYITAAYAGEKQVFERAIPTPDGSVRHSLATYTPYMVNGGVDGIFVHVADVTPLKKLEAELRAAKSIAEHRAMHDMLTGLPNRLRLLETLGRSIALARRKGRTIAVLNIDVDDFKKINDAYGHAMGDRFLVEVAARLRACARESEIVGRMGGDEFLLIAPDISSATEAEQIAARLLQAAGHPVRLDGKMMLPTLSVGIALYPSHGDSASALLAASDRAMYEAKRLGKNRYAICGEVCGE